LSPDTSSNHLSTAFIAQRFSTQASPIKRISSAYYNKETLISELTWKPLKNPKETALLDNAVNPSATRRELKDHIA
jgi:hypothetical protein